MKLKSSYRAEQEECKLFKLKKVELLGFKSFADRTRLEFADGVAAVVGPNGCGKSNLSDSISWVLGEQSARMLRGERMADVIFNGTSTRPPTGLAEVSLTLIDPEYTGVPAGEEGLHAVASPEGEVEANLPSDAESTGESIESEMSGSNGHRITSRTAKPVLRQWSGEIVV